MMILWASLVLAAFIVGWAVGAMLTARIMTEQLQAAPLLTEQERRAIQARNSS